VYLRHTVVRKGGRAHGYWRLVRSVRRGRKVVQETVAQLGELDGEVQSGLAAQCREQPVGLLRLDDALRAKAADVAARLKRLGQFEDIAADDCGIGGGRRSAGSAEPSFTQPGMCRTTERPCAG